MVYYVIGGLTAFVDLTGFPSFFKYYRVQDKNEKTTSPEKFKHMLWQTGFNILVVGPSISLLYVPLVEWRGNAIDADIPTFATFMQHLYVYVLVEEVMFFYAHWALHHKSLYGWIHKKHHEWKQPIGMVAIYAHPIEHLLSNVIPVLTGPFLMKSPAIFYFIWTFIVLQNTIVSHSGYHFPMLGNPEFHDYHHLKFNENFGLLGVLDYVHGTNKKYLNSVQGKFRHRTLFLQPVRISYPLTRGKQE